MLVSKSASAPYTLAPKGTYQAVCVDIIDEGLHPNIYKDGNPDEPKLSIVFQLDKEDENGFLYKASRWFTVSLHERSSLAAFLCEWHDATYKELPSDFDLEELIGRNARLRIVQEPKKNNPDEMKVVIKSIEPVDEAAMIARDYERIYKRAPREDGDGADSGGGLTNKFRPSAPVERAEFLPSEGDNGDVRPNRARYAPQMPSTPSNGATEPDPRSVNKTTAQSMKDARAARVAETADDEDDGLGSVFDDE